MSSRALLHAMLAFPALFAAGCSCNDQEFLPLEYGDLTDDYGKWLSMDVAPNGSPVMAYYDVTAGALGFATGNLRDDANVQWRHEQVDGWSDGSGLDVGDFGQFASMKVASDGTVWIAYKAGTQLKVAHRVDSKWTLEVADPNATNGGSWASLALDSKDRPVVAHQDTTTGTLRMAHRGDDGVWTSEVGATGQAYNGVDAEGNAVTRPANVGMYADLVIADDTEYVAYFDAAQQDLHLLEGFAGGYSTDVVYHTDGGNVGHWPSLWTDGTTAAIAFEDRGNGDLMFATRSNGADFVTTQVDNGEFTGSDAEIFSDDGKFGILYFDGRGNDMRYAKQTDAGWETSTVGGETTAVGFFNETIHTRDARYVASYDYTNRTLFFRTLE